jgi:hypothetical protein
LLILATGLAGCDSTAPLPPAILVNPPTLTLQDGQAGRIVAKLRNTKGQRTVQWTSSNPNVATVDLIGNVTAIRNGTTNVVVALSEDSTVSTTIPITVSGPAVASVTITPSAATVYIGLARQVFASLRAADGRVLQGRAVTWSTPDPTIADISTSGIVRGRAPGGPIPLTATSEGRSGTVQVRVAHSAELCPFVTPIAIGQRTEGRLALGDCEFSGDESYVDVYEFTLATPARVQVDMTSLDLDSYLGLFDASSGNSIFIDEDDNSGGREDARIVEDLAPGKYRIWANTVFATSSGAYSLLVTAQSAGGQSERVSPSPNEQPAMRNRIVPHRRLERLLVPGPLR